MVGPQAPPSNTSPHTFTSHSTPPVDRHDSLLTLTVSQFPRSQRLRRIFDAGERIKAPATMARNLFSVPIFFIVFRETLEAAIIISVLLGLVEQLVRDDPASKTLETNSTTPSIAGSGEKTTDAGHGGVALSHGAAVSTPWYKKIVPTKGTTNAGLPSTQDGEPDESELEKRRLIRKLRLQVRSSNNLFPHR